jgi:enamine deaminase RidA (YjgF/YER057c/UK114 family)
MEIPTSSIDSPTRTEALAKPAGHYSHAVCHQGLLYLSGQLPERPGASEPNPSGSFEDQMLALLANCDNVLHAWGSSRHCVLVLTLYLTDLGNWESADKICANFFGTHRPARTVLGVAGIRKGYAVQASLTAAVLPAGQTRLTT